MVNKIDLEVYIMNKLDIQNEIIEVLINTMNTIEVAHEYYNAHKDIVERAAILESIKRKVLNGDNIPD